MIFIVVRWEVSIQEYVQVFGALTAEDCDEWIKVKRAIGDRTTYLIRVV